MRRTGGRAVWTEDHVGRALHPEFNPIVAPQLAPVHPFSIDESAVPAALIAVLTVGVNMFTDAISAVILRGSGHHTLLLNANFNIDTTVA